MKNVVITGASRGIGYAIADIFARNGYNLYLTSVNEMNLYKALERLLTKYDNIEAHAKAFDLSDKKQAVDFGKWVLDQAVPEVLINNTGVYEPGTVCDEPDGTLERLMATNLYSAYHVTRTLVPAMKLQGRGHIFNICSIASLQAYSNGGAYSISKYALHGFSKNLREELKSYNIKVTSVFPGAVLTDSWGDFDNRDHRIMAASDVASMIFTAAQLSIGACVEDIVLRPQLGDL
ncbi:Sepiapterin reductase [Mycovorax composti]|uniref:Sepiapterin reductase n=2 Tax=Chitinophagaceae TaxID=563835 RepID=A0ABZ2EHW2_9BACT